MKTKRKRALPYQVVPYAVKGPEMRLDIRMVRRFRDICKEGMEVRAEQTRYNGFASDNVVHFGNEEVRIVRMAIRKKYLHIALMEDGHCQRWEDLALLNLDLDNKTAPGKGEPELFL